MQHIKCPFLRGVLPRVNSIGSFFEDVRFVGDGSAALLSTIAVLVGALQRWNGVRVKGVLDVLRLDAAPPASHVDLFASWTPEAVRSWLTARADSEGRIVLQDLEALKAAVAASGQGTSPGIASNAETQLLMHLAARGDDPRRPTARVEDVLHVLFDERPTIPAVALDSWAVVAHVAQQGGGGLWSWKP